MKADPNFKVENDVKSLGIKGIYFLMKNMTNSELDDEFEKVKSKFIDQYLITLSNEFIDTDPVILGYRELHTKINRSNRKFISSPENLLYFLLKNKKMPHINTLVDIYNLISIKYRLALGCHDIDNVVGDVTLRYTNGDEVFIPLGQADPKPVLKGDYAYIDDSNEIICHLEVRQVEKTKIRVTTKDAFYIVQGNEKTSQEYLKIATDELKELTQKYCGGDFIMLDTL